MAHAALHFSVGFVCGMALGAPRLRRALRNGHGIAPAMRNWVLLSWGIGAYALIPSFLGHLGLPDWIHRGWWMNVFVLHPLLNRLITSATLLGQAMFVACLAFQYVCLLAALVRVRGATTRQR